MDGVGEQAPVHESEIQSQSQKEITKFLTKVWEHSLLDLRTREYRTQGIENFERLAAELGVNPEDYVGTPYGSVRWSVKSESETKATGTSSDFDVYLIAKDDETAEKLKAANHQILFGDCDLSIQRILTLEQIRKHTDKEQLYATQEEINLLLTPDEYVLGNINLARELRVEAVNSLQDNLGDEAWDSEQNSYKRNFERDFKGWPGTRNMTLFRDSAPVQIQDVTTETTYQHPIRERLARFRSRLFRRARQTQRPDVYIRKFMQSYNSMDLPKFSMYRDAVRASKGELHIDPKYTAYGVD